MKKQHNIQKLQNNGVMVKAMRPLKGMREVYGKLSSRLEWPKVALSALWHACGANVRLTGCIIKEPVWTKGMHTCTHRQ